MNEKVKKLEALLEKLTDLYCEANDIETSARLKLMEVISELDEKVTKFEQWADEQGVWSEFATEGLLIDENKPWAIEKVSI